MSGPGSKMNAMATAAPSRASIAELRAGDELRGVFACVRKDRLTAKTGTPYLAVELSDRTGSIAGRAFRDADFLAGGFERGDLVRAAGRVERFRDELQVELTAIRATEPGDADPADFLPVAYRDLDELDGFLEHLAREVYDRDLRRLLAAFLDDAGVPRRAAPGAVHARRPPRVPRRPARAHRRGRDARARGVRAPPAAELGRAADGGDPARRGQDARVRARGRDRAQRRRASCSGTWCSGSG